MSASHADTAVRARRDVEDEAPAIRRRLAKGSTTGFYKHKLDGRGDLNLTLSDILFIVMSSNALPERALWVSKTWCSYKTSRCLFVSDKPICDGEDQCLPTISVAPQERPKNCCRKDSFFCDAHRQATLRAQYRFLPALQAVKLSDDITSGAVKWVVIVDDDSWVFTANLLGLLERFPHDKPLYLGDFGKQTGSSFACGGGGSVLSRDLVARMNLTHCIAQLQSHCMQSDWMISFCAAHASAVYVNNYGCDTCRLMGKKTVSQVKKRLRRQCFFMQNAKPFMHLVRPMQRRYPAIVHAYATTKRKLWRWFLFTDETGRWDFNGTNGTAAFAALHGGDSGESPAEGGAFAAGAPDVAMGAMPVPGLTDQMVASMGDGGGEDEWRDRHGSSSSDPLEQLRFHALTSVEGRSARQQRYGASWSGFGLPDSPYLRGGVGAASGGLEVQDSSQVAGQGETSTPSKVDGAAARWAIPIPQTEAERLKARSHAMLAKALSYVNLRVLRV